MIKCVEMFVKQFLKVYFGLLINFKQVSFCKSSFIAREAQRTSSFSGIWESNRMDKMPKNGRRKLFEGSFLLIFQF